MESNYVKIFSYYNFWWHVINRSLNYIGGGLGGTRRGGADVNIKHSGREDNERERERYLLYYKFVVNFIKLQLILN